LDLIDYYKEFKEKSSSPIILLPIELRPDGYAYAIIPLKHGDMELN